MAIAWENIIGGGNVEDNQPPPNAYSMFSQLFHNLRQNTKSKIAPNEVPPVTPDYGTVSGNVFDPNIYNGT